MKMSVVYFSKSGNTKQMAEQIVQGMTSVEGVQAKAMSIENIDEAWIKESGGVIFGTPTYYADMSGAVKVFLEKCGQYGLAGKIGGAFATADYIHGGGEMAIQNILTHLMVFGMMVYSGGGSYGKPVIHLGPVAITGNYEAFYETFKQYGSRMATKTKELLG